eukprot:g927.t1
MLFHPKFKTVGQVSGPLSGTGSGEPADVFLFDLDALVPSPYGRMEDGFAQYLAEFAEHRPCYLLSNCNYAEVMTRLPAYVRNAFSGIFTSAGTELWGKRDVLVRHEHDFSDDLYEFLVKVVQTSAFPHKRSPVLDNGSATIRVQLAGSRSTANQRQTYLAWEKEHQELPSIMKEFQVRFPDHRIYQDSDSSLLIMPASFSTALVRNHILKRHRSARLISYLAPQSTSSYAAPLLQAMLGSDVVSDVSAPSDVSQLMSYEKRRSSGLELPVTLPVHQFEEA